MKVTLLPSFELTTEHASSSYGQPVLVNRDTGEAFGPDDIVKCYSSWPHQPARRAVERMARRKKLSDDQKAFVIRFLNFGK
jgi:hypothetical protein